MPSPPYCFGTSAQRTPPAPSSVRTARGISPATSHPPALYPTRRQTFSCSAASPSDIAVRGRLCLEPADERGHALDRTEVGQLQVWPGNHHGVGLLQEHDQLHGEHGVGDPGGEE